MIALIGTLTLLLRFGDCCVALSAVAPQPWPHLGPGLAGPSAQADMSAPFLVADAVRVGQRGHGPHAGEELPQVGGVPGAVDGPGHNSHHGAGAGAAWSPPPVAVVPADGFRQADSPAQLVDGAGLAVVGGEDHRAGSLP